MLRDPAMPPPCPHLPQPRAALSLRVSCADRTLPGASRALLPGSAFPPPAGARGAEGSALRALTERWGVKPLLGRGAATGEPSAHGGMRESRRRTAASHLGLPRGEAGREALPREAARIHPRLRGCRGNELRGGEGGSSGKSERSRQHRESKRKAERAFRAAERLGRAAAGGALCYALPRSFVPRDALRLDTLGIRAVVTFRWRLIVRST